MAKSEVVRVDSALVHLARTEGATLGRSTAAQLSHWARLGRALEHSKVPASTIHAVLAGQTRFDDLDDADQQAVSDLWSQQIADAISGLDLAAVFAAERAAYAELDDEGNIVETGRTDADVARVGGVRQPPTEAIFSLVEMDEAQQTVARLGPVLLSQDLVRHLALLSSTLIVQVLGVGAVGTPLGAAFADALASGSTTTTTTTDSEAAVRETS